MMNVENVQRASLDEMTDRTVTDFTVALSLEEMDDWSKTYYLPPSNSCIVEKAFFSL
ncbi:hypothetical protein HFA01_31840 [Halobacillus faecis]|uniref:Uncharacterized protein n=1 Tax=Halobacillus faecis TaxID=360184 RepID=A0A511WYT5_9BACI|nr:hypothetical protein HFA01_31840 [Halobacillus faecis]